MVHYMFMSGLSCLFSTFLLQDAYTRVPSYLLSFCIYLPLSYDMFSVAQTLNYNFYLLSTPPLPPAPWKFPSRPPWCTSNPFSFFSNLVSCLQAFCYHFSTPFNLLWGGFCFLSWLPSWIYWNRSAGKSLKWNAWPANVWVFPSLKIKYLYILCLIDNLAHGSFTMHSAAGDKPSHNSLSEKDLYYLK